MVLCQDVRILFDLGEGGNSVLAELSELGRLHNHSVVFYRDGLLLFLDRQAHLQRQLLDVGSEQLGELGHVIQS